MTIQKWYNRAGGSYEDVLQRLGSETRMKKVLGMFSRDVSMQAPRLALEQKQPHHIVLPW